MVKGEYLQSVGHGKCSTLSGLPKAFKNSCLTDVLLKHRLLLNILKIGGNVGLLMKNKDVLKSYSEHETSNNALHS